MVDLNHRERTIKVKIAYYGPALCGKTTNLKVLHERALGSRRGELVSVNSAQDRTILCDLLPLRSGGFRGYDLKLQLLAVPGQAIYAMTRRVVLKGADGVVFVANSASDRWHENVQSYEEMKTNLVAQQLDPNTIPLVLQYNKRDLPEILEIETLTRALNVRRVQEFPAVASRGEGVLETFSAIVTFTIYGLCRRFRTLELPPGQTIEAWTDQAIEGMFGASRVDSAVEAQPAAEPEPDHAPLVAAEPSGHLRIRIPMPEETPPPPAGPAPAGSAPAAPAAPVEIRSAESLAESYAEASAELGFVVSDLREERDLARLRLEEVRQALELATETPGLTDVETRVRRVLRVLVRAAGATSATLLLSSGDTTQVLALPPLVSDPLSRTIWGADRVAALRDLDEPRVEEAVESPELASALRVGEPTFEAVAAVPLRSAERLLGLSLLYYGAHAVLPARETLLHLGFLARVLAGPLEASAAREAASAADRLRVLSRAAATAVASLLTRLPPESARRQSLRLGDVLGPLQAPGITVQVSEGTPPVRGDAPLLRFAVATLVHQCETEALERGEVPVVTVRAVGEEARARVSVSGGGRASVLAGAEARPDVSDAEMSVVQAVIALHGGGLSAARGENGTLHFTVELLPA